MTWASGLMPIILVSRPSSRQMPWFSRSKFKARVDDLGFNVEAYNLGFNAKFEAMPGSSGPDFKARTNDLCFKADANNLCFTAKPKFKAIAMKFKVQGQGR